MLLGRDLPMALRSLEAESLGASLDEINMAEVARPAVTLSRVPEEHAMRCFTFHLHNGLANRSMCIGRRLAGAIEAEHYAHHLLSRRPRYRQVLVMDGDALILSLDQGGVDTRIWPAESL